MSSYTIRILESEISNLTVEKARLVEMQIEFKGTDGSDDSSGMESINKIQDTIDGIRKDIKTLNDETTIDSLFQ